MNTQKLFAAACISALLVGWGPAVEAGRGQAVTPSWPFGKLFNHGDDGRRGDSARKHSHKGAGFIKQFQVLATGPAFGGATPPGAKGPYKYIAGIVHGELDPRNPLNRGRLPLSRMDQLRFSGGKVVFCHEYPPDRDRVGR